MVEELLAVSVMKVLIIDDDEDDRILLREALEEVGCRPECLEAHDGHEALKLLRHANYHKPEVIFLDLNMPRVNGIQCLRELKMDKLLKDIPVIIYTTSKQESDREQTKKLGAEFFLSKPTSFKKLCRILSQLFEAKILSEAKITPRREPGSNE
jgi:CheY-like chemotaxis protein